MGIHSIGSRLRTPWRRVLQGTAGLALAGVIASTAACGGQYIRATTAPVTSSLPASSITRHVVVVSVDGLRPDATEAYAAPTIQRLMREGSYTLDARTIEPSKTLPSHTSMLTGLTPDKHHVLWNTVVTADADAISLPNVFSVARQHGYRTAAFFSKAKFQPLQLPGTLDYTQAPGGLAGRWSSRHTVRDVTTYLADEKPNLLFVHLTDPDAAGHRYGWMTPEYGEAVLRADEAIGDLVAIAERTFGHDNVSFIVTADHGGHGTDHGSDDPQDVTIPWIAWGRGVHPGELSAAHVRTMDTAATTLWLLGLEPPDDWAGRPVVQAFAEPVEQEAPVTPTR